MNTPQPNISVPASLVGEPTRAAILMALCDGRAHAAGALARALQISPQSASNHLARLVDGGLLVAVRQGRHKYYRIASAEVAHSIEALAAIAPPIPWDRLRNARAGRELMLARRCYRHLAGRLGVALLESMLQRGYVLRTVGAPGHRSVFEVTPAGKRWLARMGVVPPPAGSCERPQRWACGCLDWTERREHMAGRLADALLCWFQTQGYLLARAGARGLQLTAEGALYFERELNITPADLELLPGGSCDAAARRPSGNAPVP